MIDVKPSTALPRTRFVLPDGVEAAVPPEARGIERDGIRLLVVGPDGVSDRRFRDLPQALNAGDLVVVNTSATLPAALTASRGHRIALPVHVAGWVDPSTWIIEARREDNSGPDPGAREGDVFQLPGGLELRLLRPYPDSTVTASRLWMAAVSPATAVVPYLGIHGRPITYRHLAGALPLSAYQTVYADEPGSAEMPSAGRPFTADLLVRLMARGITVAPVTLHAGVSSPELHELPAPERYRVPAATARLVESTRQAGRRVVAVGTTVVRALESATTDGVTRAAGGWTDLVLGPDRPARVVNGLVTGLHLPESSHLLLLESVVGEALVESAYATAIELGYLWHEFGDSMLFLP